MKIVFFSDQQELVHKWREVADSKIDCVQMDVRDVRLTYRPAVFVSPANSFGFMDGGLDLVYREMWPGIEEDVRGVIRRGFGGELLVGQAFRFNSLVVAPTMRVPMILPKGTVNPYLATRAAILEAIATVGVNDVVAVPGMGTGVGRVPFDVCARQMVRGVNDAFNGARIPETTFEAMNIHQKLYRDELKNLELTDA